MAPKRERDSGKLVAENRKARFNYEIEEKLEAGMRCTGTEVKSLRTGQANIAESYASTEDGELPDQRLYPRISQAGRANHEPTRRRKLLLHRSEIDKLRGAVEREGMTLVPLKLYFNARGIAKLKLASPRARSCTTSARPRRSATGSARRPASCARRAERGGRLITSMPVLPCHARRCPATDGSRWSTLRRADRAQRRHRLSVDRAPRPPDPPGWDDIPGAHGSTPEIEGFRDRHARLRARSARRAVWPQPQTTEYQRELVARLGCRFRS